MLGVAYDELSTILWKEQELLDLLLFKATEKQYMIATGQTRWLGHLGKEIDTILQHMREEEVLRAAETEAIAAELGLDANPSLRQVAAACPEPWKDLFLKHHEALQTLLNDIKTLSDSTRTLVDSGLTAINDALRSVQPSSAGTYDSMGRQTTASNRALTLDGSL